MHGDFITIIYTVENVVNVATTTVNLVMILTVKFIMNKEWRIVTEHSCHLSYIAWMYLQQCPNYCLFKLVRPILFDY